MVYEGVVDRAAPADITYTITIGQTFCYEPAPGSRNGEPITQRPPTSLDIERTDPQVTLNIPAIPITCSR